MRHHEWHDFGHEFKRRGRRGFFERGVIKFVILDLLKEQSRHGYDIIREMEDRSAGCYSPSPGVIYPTLQALEDQDLVRSATEEGGKKVYSITEAGIAYLDAHKEQAREQREWMGPSRGRRVMDEGQEAVREMKWFMRDLGRSIHGVVDNPDKMREIREVVKDARKKIEEIVSR